MQRADGALMGIGLSIAILAVIVIGVIALVRRVAGARESAADSGGDLLAYLLMALAVGVAGFALASLAAVAFPAEDFVIDVRARVANSLAALVVASPVAILLWRRQERRRDHYPGSTGWTVYLALMEAVFVTSLVAALFGLFEWIFADGGAVAWTNIVVFGGFVLFHEWAARRTPPASDGADLPRVVGSAIGLVATVIGVGGITAWLLDEIYSTLAPTAGDADLGTFVSFLLAGAPVWYYRWLRPWPEAPDTPRKAWTTVVAVAGLSTGIGAVVFIVIQSLLFLFTETAAAGAHFDFLPASLSVAVVGGAVWGHHRGRLGPDRTDPVRAHDYALAAIGLATTVGGATALATAAFGSNDLVGAQADLVVTSAVTLLAGATVWLFYWLRAERLPPETEAVSAPRRFYLVGLAVVLGLTAAGALIASLVILFQRLLGPGGEETVVVPASLFVFAGLAAWHLLRANAADRELIGDEETLTPFTVTIVCSHPGMVSTRFPTVAKVRVIYRDDDSGVVDDTMADRIVEAVGHRSSLVWVDEDGFRVAPAR